MVCFASLTSAVRSTHPHNPVGTRIVQILPVEGNVIVPEDHYRFRLFHFVFMIFDIRAFDFAI